MRPKGSVPGLLVVPAVAVRMPTADPQWAVSGLVVPHMPWVVTAVTLVAAKLAVVPVVMAVTPALSVLGLVWAVRRPGLGLLAVKLGMQPRWRLGLGTVDRKLVRVPKVAVPVGQAA